MAGFRSLRNAISHYISLLYFKWTLFSYLAYISYLCHYDKLCEVVHLLKKHYFDLQFEKFQLMVTAPLLWVCDRQHGTSCGHIMREHHAGASCGSSGCLLLTAGNQEKREGGGACSSTFWLGPPSCKQCHGSVLLIMNAACQSDSISPSFGSSFVWRREWELQEI